MYKCNQEFKGGDGIVMKDIETTIKGIGRLGKDGMRQTNEEIIRLIQAQDIPAVFTEINGTADAAELVARETGCAVFSLDTAISTTNYLSAMRRNIDTIKEALG